MNSFEVYEESNKFKIKKIILEDGTELSGELSGTENCNITYFLAIKEKKAKKYSDFGISYNANNSKDYVTLSNIAFMLASVFKYMKTKNLSFDNAVKLHNEIIKQAEMINRTKEC